MKNIFTCIAVILGAIIGAGFASGREIINFFNVYNEKGLVGIFISSFLFGFVIVLITFIIKRENIKDYKSLIRNNKFIQFIIDIFSFVCFCIMISGVGAFFEEQFKINFWIGTSFASAISYAIFLNRFKSLEIFSMILVPFIVIGILCLGFSNYEEVSIACEYNLETSVNGNYFFSAILYTSYNSLILIPFLINLKKYNLTKVKILLIGVITSFLLGFLMFLIYRINNLFYPEIISVELPNMRLASLLSNEIKIFYGIVILAAIFTTAFSCGFNFLEMKKKENYEKNALLICVLAFLFSKIGFSNMINICFPFFGVFGLFQIILLIIIGVKNDEK